MFGHQGERGRRHALRFVESAERREAARREQRQFGSKERTVGSIAERVRVDDPHEVCDVRPAPAS